MRKSIGPSFVVTLVAAAALWSSAVAATLPDESAAVMLRRDVLDRDASHYDVPAPLAGLPPESWPTEGWQRLRLLNNRIDSESVTGGAEKATLESILAARAEEANEIYLRVPGTALRSGPLRTVVFRNGTSSLVPELGYRYELALEERPFAFSVQNGLRTANGTPYGTGARYLVEYDGQTHEYLVGEFGWSSRIEAIVDLDGDGKPDFILHVDGNGGDDEVILMSSRARPGRNAPTARLHANGC